MEIKTWAPFDVDRDWRLFDFPRLAREMAMPGFRPSIDVVRDGESLTVTAELPGIDPEHVEVDLIDEALVIKGEKTEDHEVSEDDLYVHERAFGTFERRIGLPSGIDPDGVSAHFDNGVLTVRVEMPKEVESGPRKIPVSTKTPR